MTAFPSRWTERTLTELDHARLNGLLRREGQAERIDLRDLLDGADLVPSREVSPDIVTVHSQVLLGDPATAQRRKLTLCYPLDAEPASGFISVLSPLGLALLGRRVGESVHWRTPDGQAHSADLLAILFQPEASGDYTL